MADGLNPDVSHFGAGGQNNPIGQLGQMTQVLGAMQTLRARQAMGPLAQASVDPQTGQMDYNKFGLLISSHPETAFMAPEVLNQLAQRQLIQTQNMKEQLEIAMKKREVINNAIAPLVRMGPGVTQKDVMNVLTSPEILGGGIMTPQEAVAMVSSLPKGGQELQQHILNHAMASAGADNSMKYVMGQFETMKGPNGEDLHGWASPLFGTFREANTPRASALAPVGTPSAGSAAAQTLTNAAPGQPGQLGASPPGGLPTTPTVPPGSEGGPSPGPIRGPDLYRQGALGEAHKYENDVNDRASAARNLLALFGQVQGYLKDFHPGGGTELRADMAQLAQALGMPESTLKEIAGGDLSSIQAARKLFFGIGSQMAGQIIKNSGGRMTQTEWAQTLLKGSPNLDLDEKAISKIMGSMRDLSHFATMEQRHLSAMKENHVDPTTWQNKWGETLDHILAQRYGAQ